MKISLKVEYACRVLGQLARSFGRTELPHIEELAEAEAIPANYLVQILNELRNGGLIVSRRGKQGGYALAREASSISLAEVIRAVDGELLGFTAKAEGQSGGAVSAVWAQVATEFEKETKGFSVEDFAREGAGEMYYI